MFFFSLREGDDECFACYEAPPLRGKKRTPTLATSTKSETKRGMFYINSWSAEDINAGALKAMGVLQIMFMRFVHRAIIRNTWVLVDIRRCLYHERGTTLCSRKIRLMRAVNFDSVARDKTRNIISALFICSPKQAYKKHDFLFVREKVINYMIVWFPFFFLLIPSPVLFQWLF